MSPTARRRRIAVRAGPREMGAAVRSHWGLADALRSDRHQLEPDRTAAPARDRAVRRHRRPRPAQAPARPLPSRRKPACCPSAGSSARRSTTSTTTASALRPPARSTTSPTTACPTTDWEAFCSRLFYVAEAAGDEALAKIVSELEDELGGDVARLHYLSVPPAAAPEVVARLGDARAGRAARASSWRSRSAPTSPARWS